MSFLDRPEFERTQLTSQGMHELSRRRPRNITDLLPYCLRHDEKEHCRTMWGNLASSLNNGVLQVVRNLLSTTSHLPWEVWISVRLEVPRPRGQPDHIVTHRVLWEYTGKRFRPIDPEDLYRDFKRSGPELQLALLADPALEDWKPVVVTIEVKLEVQHLGSFEIDGSEGLVKQAVESVFSPGSGTQARVTRKAGDPRAQRVDNDTVTITASGMPVLIARDGNQPPRVERRGVGMV